MTNLSQLIPPTGSQTTWFRMTPLLVLNNLSITLQLTNTSVQGGPEKKNAQSSSHDILNWTIHQYNQIFVTKMFSKDYLLPNNTKFV